MPDIDESFIEQYNADVHLNFRQFGSRLMGMTRKGVVQGSTAWFQKFGTVTTQTKTRRGTHTFQAPDHSKVSVTMADRYVPTAVDELDLLKQNIDERQAHARSHVAAMASYMDNVILGAIETGAEAGDLGDATAAFGYGHAMRIVNQFMINEVPDDGQRFVALHPYAWSQFLQVSEFANADYIGADALPFKGGMTAKMWMGCVWFPLPNISWSTPDGNTANVATNLAWHRSIVGHGVNKEPETTWSYENTMSAYAAVSKLSMGAVIIEDKGAFVSSSLSPQPAIT